MIFGWFNSTTCEENIPILAAGLKKPGYIQEVKAILSEFMQYGLKPEDVEKLLEYAEHKRPLYLKLKDETEAIKKELEKYKKAALAARR